MVPTFTANGLAEYAICGGDIDLRALAQKQVGQSYFAPRSSDKYAYSTEHIFASHFVPM